LNLYSLFL